MPKSILIIIIVILLILGFIFVAGIFSSKPQPKLPVTEIKIKDAVYQLEIARSTLEHSKGLSGRTELCPQCGMVFIFDFPSTLPFWMKDTLIPLDLIWLDSQGKIVTIHTADPQPGVSDFQLKRYTNTSPAKYVIELNANDHQKLDLKVGDIIDLTQLNGN